MICEECGKDVDALWTAVLVRSPHEVTLRLCRDCHEERSYPKTLVGYHCYRARKLGLASTLTVEQWKATYNYFHRLCAYCQQSPGLFMEHFIPMNLGGGTTADNCVPACRKCNIRKSNVHPDQVTRIPREAIERVRVFLDQQKS